jgi:hypothetical protein
MKESFTKMNFMGREPIDIKMAIFLKVFGLMEKKKEKVGFNLIMVIFRLVYGLMISLKFDIQILDIAITRKQKTF